MSNIGDKQLAFACEFCSKNQHDFWFAMHEDVFYCCGDCRPSIAAKNGLNDEDFKASGKYYKNSILRASKAMEFLNKRISVVKEICGG